MTAWLTLARSALDELVEIRKLLAQLLEEARAR